MVQHLLRCVRDKNRLLLLKYPCHIAYARNSATNLDRGRIRFALEFQNVQMFSISVQYIEVGSMEGTTTGQNATHAVQHGLYRGLIGHGAGHVQQSSISISVSRYHVRIQVLVRQQITLVSQFT